MKSGITKFAAAAVIIVAALSLTIFNNSITPAYALEQTIEACGTIDRVYFTQSLPETGLLKEVWIEYDDNQEPENVRINYHWPSGMAVTVWKEEVNKFWQGNTLRISTDKIYSSKILRFAHQYNPIGAVKYLQQLKDQGKVKIRIDHPSDEIDSIVVTATYLPNEYYIEGTTPEMQSVYYIDPASKLVRSVKNYELQAGEFVYKGRWDFVDYDPVFEEDLFDIESELPADIERTDISKLDFGLEQGSLTDKEIAVKLIRRFLQALIEKEYAIAGKFIVMDYKSMPAEEIQKRRIANIVKIVSIDEPYKLQKPGPGYFLGVPFTIQLDENGQVHEIKMKLAVLRWPGTNNSWVIGGGNNALKE